MEEVVTIHHEVKEIELISPSFPSTVDQTDAFVCWDKAKWSHNEEQRVHNAVERRKTYNRLRSLVWKDISLSVQVNEKSKKLLQKVSGSIQTGEMLAIMGPSGSGKTTLLKLLSGGWRTVSRNPAKERQFSGIIKVDGVTNPKLKTQKQIASVAQIEELPAGLTLYQNLRITALLNRPTNRRTKEEQLKFLDEIIDILELTDSKNTPCAVLSGGQQRRVSVAVQLLAESSLLLCDEPTSGLDSQIASKLLHTFRNLADRKGMGIVCSIHQPSAVLFNLFDKVLVLSEGRPVYYGHTSKVFDYCNRISMQYPSGWNASDVLLSVLCDTPSPLTEKSIAINEVTTSLLSTILNIENEYWSENLVKEGAGGSLSSIYEENDKHIGWLEQTSVLMGRSFLQKRGEIFTWLESFRVAAIAIFASLIWFQLPMTSESLQNRYNALFYAISFWYTTPILSGVMAFPFERRVVTREVSTQSYRLSAYFVAKSLSELSAMFLYPTLFVTLFYWTVGFQTSSQFIVYWLSILLLVVCSDSLGLAISASINNIPKAVNLALFAIIFLLLVSGLYVSLGLMPIWIRWTSYLSYVRYIFSILAQMELKDRMFGCDTNLDCVPTSGNVLLDRNDLDIIPKWACALIVIGMSLFFRLVAFVQLARHTGARIR